MKLKHNQSGAAHIVAILLVILIAAVGVVGWKVWDNSKDTAGNNSSTSQNNDTEASDDVETSSAKQLEISEWQVGFDIPSTISDLKVDSVKDYPSEGGSAESSVTILDSPALEAAGKIKTTGTQERHEKLGQIVRQKSGTDYYPGTTIEQYAETNSFAGVKVGEYYYVYVTTYASDNADAYLDAIKSNIQSSLASIN